MRSSFRSESERLHLLALVAGALAVVASCSPASKTGPVMANDGGSAISSETAAPAVAEWVLRAPLPERRTEVSATTDGRYIYLAGGFGPPEGEGRASSVLTLWRYDPQSDEWTALTDIPQGVHHAPFQHHAGRLYILGGFRGTSFEPVANVRIYDIAADAWTEGARMPTPRGASAWAMLNGRIHVIGGNAEGDEAIGGQEGARILEDRSVNVHEAYDPATDSWTRLRPMPTPRNHLGAAAANGRIHAVLGRAAGDYTLTTHEIYDPAADLWTSGPPVPTGRSGVAVLEHDGWVYTFGGERLDRPNQGTFDATERFDSRTERWERLPPMRTSRHGLGAAAIGGSIHVVSGGPQPGFTFGNAHERLDP